MHTYIYYAAFYIYSSTTVCIKKTQIQKKSRKQPKNSLNTISSNNTPLKKERDDICGNRILVQIYK